MHYLVGIVKKVKRKYKESYCWAPRKELEFIQIEQDKKLTVVIAQSIWRADW